MVGWTAASPLPQHLAVDTTVHLCCNCRKEILQMNRIFEGYAQTHPFSREVLIIDENLSATILKPERSQRCQKPQPRRV